MINAALIRTYKDENGTIGRILIDGREICKTLERPKTYKGVENVKDDKKTSSTNESCCVLEGDYIVDWTFSPHFGKGLFLLLGTENRSEVRIHAANVIDQLLGCIAPCLGYKKTTFKNKKYEYFALSSCPALELLYREIPKDKNGKFEKWNLKITSEDSLCKLK